MRQALLLSFVAIVASIQASSARADWSIDLSRRAQQMRKDEMGIPAGRGPASVRARDEDTGRSVRSGAFDAATTAPSEEETSFIGKLFDPGETTQDIVILNTERGFVPNTVRVRRDGRYMIHVVNVNEKEKNVSFILDGFSEHHATYFGKVKSFKLEPRKEGIYSFLSPETAAEGRVIVFVPQSDVKVRQPAQSSATETKETREMPEQLVGGIR